MTTYAKMDPVLKTEWVTALRSGKYRQGKERLVSLKNKRYSYCCLGVLCNLDTENVERVLVAGKEWYGYFDGSTTEESFLPAIFAKRVGLSAKVQDKLARMNDDGDSFSKIADWIEANL